MLRLFQRPVRPGGGHLQRIASLDGVGLVQRVGKRPADRLAVLNGDAARLIQVNAQKPASGLPDIFHIPQGAARLPNNGSRQRRRRVGYLGHAFPPYSPNPKKLLFAFYPKERAGQAPLSSSSLHVLSYYTTAPNRAQAFFTPRNG
ncbi:hypothetical protein SDC9_154335 [bioreactor metagenome]|uniref:Uncharacterized protein n=1 Tax=bioreactor metagenome TaxID=1076179 RepID=A0A645F055_9ZZZZ